MSSKSQIKSKNEKLDNLIQSIDTIIKKPINIANNKIKKPLEKSKYNTFIWIGICLILIITTFFITKTYYLNTPDKLTSFMTNNNYYSEQKFKDTIEFFETNQISISKMQSGLKEVMDSQDKLLLAYDNYQDDNFTYAINNCNEGKIIALKSSEDFLTAKNNYDNILLKSPTKKWSESITLYQSMSEQGVQMALAMYDSCDYLMNAYYTYGNNRTINLLEMEKSISKYNQALEDYNVYLGKINQGE